MNYGSSYTNRFRNVLSIARKEAEATKSDYVGSEHLLMALLREGNGVAVKALENIFWKTRFWKQKAWDAAMLAQSICCSQF